MIPKNRITTHPGEVLLHEFLEPLAVTQAQLARHLKVSLQRINELVKGKRGVTPETAWLLSRSLNTSPESWMNLQVSYDLSSIEPPKNIKKLVA